MEHVLNTHEFTWGGSVSSEKGKLQENPTERCTRGGYIAGLRVSQHGG